MRAASQWQWTQRLVLLIVLFGAIGCVPSTKDRAPGTPPLATGSGSVEPYVIVDCLLPGQVRQLGRSVTYVTRKRPIRTTAEECGIRGGESIAKADYQTSMRVWREQAETGDPEAQYYLGTINEKSTAETRPESAETDASKAQPSASPIQKKSSVAESGYSLAAEWYRKAAEQGYHPAAVNLGRLYEEGLGTPQNSAEAVKWYARASGLDSLGPSMTLGNAESQRVETLTKEKEKEQQEPEADESQRQLATVNRELEQLQSQRQEESSAADREREQLARAKEDYEAKAAELERARSAATEEDSSRREREREAFEAGLRQQQQKAAALDTEVAKRNAEIERLKKSVAELESRLAEQSTGGAGTSEGLVVEWIDPPAGVNQTQLRLRGGDQAARILAGRVVAPPGLRSISVNGRRVEVDAEGLFSVELPPFRRGQETANLELVAADGRDTRESRRVTLLRGAPGVIGQVPTPAVIGAFGNYYALVIGNNDYRHWDKLQNPVNDAKEIADVLRDRFGFKVTLLLNATREQILRSLNDLRKQLTEKDNLLIYYAGHGQLVEKIDRGYWIPVEAQLDDPTDWILTLDISDYLQLMSAKNVIVIADSCYAGKLTRSSIVKLQPGLSEEARLGELKVLAQLHSRVALTSGGVKPVLDGGAEGHSLFAYALLGVLRETDIPLEAERIYLAVRTRVVNAAKRFNIAQIPTFEPIHMAGHQAGDFIFAPRGAPLASHKPSAPLTLADASR